jgi:hypothetical protein
LRLRAFIGTDAQSWINLQTHYDTENARELTAEMHMLVQAGAETVLEGDSAPNAPRWSTKRRPMLDLVHSGVGLSLVRDSIAMRESQSRGLVIADKVSLDCTLCFVYTAQRAD